MFAMATIICFAGTLIAVFGMLVPNPIVNVLFLIVGLIMSMAGILMLMLKAVKTGVIHFFYPPRNDDSTLWFYIRRDGTVKITPAFRMLEGMSEDLYGTKIIKDMKSYRLADWNVRFVPEGIGHSVDVNNVMYARVMKKQNHFESLKDGRRKILTSLLHHEEMQPEYQKQGDV